MIYWQDIRYAARLLLRSPGFTLLTVLVLAGGLAITTFTFSFLYTAMMRPLPLRAGGRIVRLTQVANGRRQPVDAVDVAALRSALRTVEQVGGYQQTEAVLGRNVDGRVLTTTVADPELFAVARTLPLLGRTLVAGDAAAGAEPVMVLAYRAWELAFGSQSSALNTVVPLNGVMTRIVGIMPKGFGFPVTQDAWIPRASQAITLADAGKQSLNVFGRLAPGATAARARTEATTILRRSLSSRDTAVTGSNGAVIVVESFPAAQIGAERTLVFTALNVAAALILLLALVNVMHLLTARANERSRETAVRLALGASRSRLIMQGM